MKGNIITTYCRSWLHRLQNRRCRYDLFAVNKVINRVEEWFCGQRQLMKTQISNGIHLIVQLTVTEFDMKLIGEA